MRKSDFTVIVARQAPSGARKYLLSRWLLLGFSVGILVLISSFILSALHYFHMDRKSARFVELSSEVDRLRRENDDFRLTAKRLTDRLSTMEVTAKKLEILSDQELGRMGGVGGPSQTDSRILRLSKRDLMRYFKTLDRKRINLSEELNRLKDYYTTRSILVAATPAIIPVRGYLSGGFGYRTDPFNGLRDFHPGIDISAPSGSKVIATADGSVMSVGRHAGYGKMIIIDHRFGISTRYGHLGQMIVRVGQKVKKGEVIGYVGSTGRSTGPHLHYEVRLHEQRLNPLRFYREL